MSAMSGCLAYVFLSLTFEPLDLDINLYKMDIVDQRSECTDYAV